MLSGTENVGWTKAVKAPAMYKDRFPAERAGGDQSVVDALAARLCFMALDITGVGMLYSPPTTTTA